MQHVSKQSRAKSRYNGRKISEILEDAHAGFAYQLLELEMTLEDENTYLGKSKLDDITSLIQLYMKAIEALEGTNDHRYKYFNRKLQRLMLKKTVFRELNNGVDPTCTKVYANENKEDRKWQHEAQLLYTTEQTRKHREKELSEAEKVLEGCENIVKQGIKKQQDSIKERIRVRREKSENGSDVAKVGSVKNLGEIPGAVNRIQHDAKINEYFGHQPEKVIGRGQRKRINFVTTQHHDV